MPFPLVAPEVAWASTYPGKWLEHYFSHDYLSVDPLLKQIAQTSSPITWASDDFKERPDFWEEARTHGVKHGWAMSTHGRHLSSGVLSLARSGKVVTDDELAHTEMKLIWLAHTAHGLISAAEMAKHAPQRGAPLTAREREVLKWSAAGKTADEIGTILGISERTVTFHVAGSLAKLDVVNKTQAVAKALLLDMLH